MAGGIDWFRWHHGSVTDPKFQLVARKAGVSLTDVIAVWAFVLEKASQNGGALPPDFADEAGEYLTLSHASVTAILCSFCDRGLMCGSRVSSPRTYFPAPQLRPSGGAWELIRALVFRRDDYTCRYCGQRCGRLECDHVIPVADGGSHDESNLVTACFSCNRSKGSKSLEKWESSHGR